MRKNNTFRRAAALMAALSITVSLAAPAFAETYYYIDDGDITITKDENGQTVKQGNKEAENIGADEEIIITTHKEATTTLESDLEGPAAEDSGFGPVVEDNYQSAQPEDAEESEDADQPESAEEPKSADRQESADQQAAPAAAPAGSTPVNKKDDGFWGNTITVINNIADKVLNLTLKDVKIDVSDTGDQYDWDQKGKAALSVQGKGNVEIELDGDNELKSGTQSAGLEKTSTGTLTLKDDNNEAGSLTATGGFNSAGIGGGYLGDGKNITITGGTVTATGGSSGAGIGGGVNGIGSKVTVSGAAQVTAIAGKGDRWDGAGATIGSGSGGSTRNPDGTFTPGSGQEIQANISGLITGWIHHIIYDPALVSEDNPDGILKEWWEPERPQPNPEDPNAPAEESNEVSLGTPVLHVETLEGDLLPFDAQQQGSTLRVMSNTLAARLHGTRQALEALREQGVEQIQFVTSLKTTTLSVEDLLAEGGSWFALEHNGLVSRRLSAAQAESLKCRMH